MNATQSFALRSLVVISLFCGAGRATAQQTWQVTDHASWAAAIAGASTNTQNLGTTDTIVIMNSFSANEQQVLNGNVTIIGGNHKGSAI